jgi:predicted nucleotidyltransferase
MKSKNDCLEELLDDDNVFIDTLINHFKDESVSASLIKSICRAEGDRDFVLFGRNLKNAIMERIEERAEAMSEKSVSPYDESNLADIEREK